MSNSERGSRQFPLRRSTRLLGKIRRSLSQLGKPAVTLKQRIKSSIRKPPQRDDDLFAGPTTYITRGGINAERFMRSARKSAACTFRREYIYDDSIDKRMYINSSGNTDTWTDRSAGCTWVAVQGMDSICVAVRETLDMDRYPGCSESMFRRFFSLNVVSEIEDITLSTSDSRQTLDKHVTKPFGVVSVIQSTGINGQASGDEASDALQYLKKRFESGLAFDHIETIQTAISALQCVCNQELKANDIWVCVLDMEGEYHLQREQLDDHLAVVNNHHPLQTDEIEEHLAVINNNHPPLQTDEIEEYLAVIDKPLLTDEFKVHLAVSNMSLQTDMTPPSSFVQPSSPLSSSCIAYAPCSSDNAATTSSPRNFKNSPLSDVQPVTMANQDSEKPLSYSQATQSMDNTREVCTGANEIDLVEPDVVEVLDQSIGINQPFGPLMLPKLRRLPSPPPTLSSQGAPSTGSKPCLPKKVRAKPPVSPQTGRVLTPINVSLDMGSPLKSLTNIMKNQDAEEEVNLMKNKSEARGLTTSQGDGPVGFQKKDSQVAGLNNSKHTSSGKGAAGRRDKENVQHNPHFLPR